MFDITSVVSTKGRYFDSLPSALISVAMQTVTPKHLIIFDDNDTPIDLRTNSLYQNIFSMLSGKGISWEVVYGQKKGQVANHQKSIEMCKTEFIHRFDDDNVLESNVLEKLLSNVTSEVGAVGGLVLDPKMTMPLTKLASNKIEDIYLGLNIQWSKGTKNLDGSLLPAQVVHHLYSTFVFRKEAAKQIGGYCMELSPKGHREETILTYSMHRAGWKILFDPNVITWHLRNATGGIR